MGDSEETWVLVIWYTPHRDSEQKGRGRLIERGAGVTIISPAQHTFAFTSWTAG